jgi:hypothetical protein
MKRIGLSLALPVLGLLVGIATPATASAQGWRGGGHVSAPAAHANGGWHGAGGGGWHGGAVATRPAYGPHVAVGARGYVGHPGYGVRPGYGYHPGYVARPGYYGHVGPVVGHWGFHGGARVWFGVATVAPYPGWLWTPGTWVWDGYQWVWQDGYWAPPVY